MLHLITGSNGTGKTLFALKWVRERQLAENRAVYYNGRFDLYDSKREEFGWEKIDFKDWQSCPDGAIFLIDECHNDMPVRPTGSRVPDHINMLGEHRKRGFDFYLITQHPSNIDAFVRRLIGAPGWHKHLKRRLGASPSVEVLTWSSVNTGCETPTGKSTADVSTAWFPKEVYSWYKSAEIHTAKMRVPRKLAVFIALLIAIPFLFWYGLADLFRSDQVEAETGSTVSASASPTASGSGLTVQGQARDSPADYLASFVPRVPSLPYTAPRYDRITEPVRAPRIAACIEMGKRCSCYTQQATPLDVPRDLCLQVVKRGHFEDFDTSDRLRRGREPDERRQAAGTGSSGVF
ncbi:hypothetical protein EBQ34_14245 [Vandammella animalimorsus]|uniref:Zona occludens toxin N-terminal domain-containing protein n=1 Tax=Vandammella animalimorsus TaxID=2029117 RepID=A0A3M6R197_9BURK|nr:zonular occludens toxin domain-containing protein [Vandammella animalimorsus]RMX09036.1 hypothetical protein EBQ34_14185 [Vandammella animalimorsus]RMX09047.1 hypothetical protein EBQ34_14245 [Vandammella animalimorsus]